MSHPDPESPLNWRWHNPPLPEAPFGPEWEAKLMNRSKRDLVMALRLALMKLDAIEGKDHRKIKENPTR